MSAEPYVSCIKINGQSILPPVMTPEIRVCCRKDRLKAVEIEKRIERKKIFKKCLDDLDRIQTFNQQMSLESQLALESPRKKSNLTSETVDISEYSDDGVRVFTNEEHTPPKLIRSNSYTLASPSPILLAHLEKEAKKCVDFNIDTEVLVETVEVKSKMPDLDPKLVEILQDIPPQHADNIYAILATQQDSNKKLSEQLHQQDDHSFSVAISSQSLYFSSESFRETPTKLHYLTNVNDNNNSEREHKAACVIQAYVRGYLIRRLIRTDKVQALIETIKDAILYAMDLHGAEIIEAADVELHRRLVQQVSAACYAFYDIFFVFDIKEQMALIASDRQHRLERAKRPLSATNLSRRSSSKMLR